ncbi:MAG: PKD domain-containing protein, partial [Desulfobacterales bacterium]
MKSKKFDLSRIINLLFRGFFSFAALTSFVILFPVMAHALTPVTVAWDANNPAPDGYMIYWGTSSGNLTNSHDAGDATQYTIPDLTEGVTYYFAATAYEDDNGVRNESAFSEELSHTIAPINSNPTTPSVPSGPASGFIQTTYSFSANASDPDDDQLEYEFDWGDGGISGWGNSTQSHTWLNTGDYCVRARASDTHGATSGWSNCGSINISLNTHTIAASAGTHGRISPSGLVTVSNGADQFFSINPDQYYRVADVVVDGSSVGSVTTYTFDNVIRDHTIVASFVVDNQPPVSNAGADQSVLVNDTVQLDGSGSSDADGDSVIFNWSLVSKPGGSSATLSNTGIVNPSFEVDVAGTYTVQLIVNDGTVNSAPDTVTISTENSAPVANAGADQAVLVDDTVQLDGSGSSDVDGDSVIFNWSLVSKPNGSDATLSNTGIVNPGFEVDVAGTYTVQL